MPLYSRRTTKLRSLIAMSVCLLLLLFMWRYCKSSFTRTQQTVNMQNLLTVSAELAKRGGDRLWNIRKDYVSDSDLDSVVKSKTKEGANEYLTKGDLESHHIIHSGLTGSFPGLKVSFVRYLSACFMWSSCL